MTHSSYIPHPSRITFGIGCIDDVPGEIARMDNSRTVIICSRRGADVAAMLAARFDPGCAILCPAARPNFPEDAFDEVRSAVADHDADAIVAIGGGTSIGLGKAVAAAMPLAYIAVPTTYSGSELASNWYVGTGARRRRGNDARALPSAIFYDPALTASLPASTSAASGMNAMAHALESLYAPDINPVVAVMAEEAIRLLGAGLPELVRSPGDLEARTLALRGAWFAAGFRARSGLEHAIAQRVRDTFGLDHARTHAVVLPYAVAFNASGAQVAIGAIARALKVNDAAAGLHALNQRLGLATGLRDLGVPRGELGLVVNAIAEAGIDHPRAASRDDIARIVDDAWAGDPPEAF